MAALTIGSPDPVYVVPLTSNGNGTATDGARTYPVGSPVPVYVVSLTSNGNGTAADGGNILTVGSPVPVYVVSITDNGNGTATDGARTLIIGSRVPIYVVPLTGNGNGTATDGARILTVGSPVPVYVVNLVTSSYDPATEAIAAAFTTPPTTARKNLIDACVISLKSAGVWAKLDALYMLAAADSQAALINWKQPGTYNGTLVNAPAFAVDRGFTGASTKYIDSGFNPSSAVGRKMLQDDASTFAWSLTDVDVNGGLYGGSGSGGIGETFLVPRFGATLYQSINGFDGTNKAQASSLGLFTGVRTDASNTRIYWNGVSTHTYIFTSQTPQNSNLFFLNRGGSYFTGQVAAGGCGSQLSAADNTALYNALRAYMTGVGVP